MNILLIGNGFDLAHGLPTKYTDFLNFVKVIREIQEKKLLHDNYPDSEVFVGDAHLHPSLKAEIYTWFRESAKEETEELQNLIENNFWLAYFLECPVYQKENWIDFESEISRIIRSIDSDMKGKDFNGQIDCLTMEYLRKRYLDGKIRRIEYGEKKYFSGITYRELRDVLLEDLNKLIRLLEIYLYSFVEKIQYNGILPDIQDIEFDKVLSFNYTNTYQRKYGNYEYSTYGKKPKIDPRTVAIAKAILEQKSRRPAGCDQVSRSDRCMGMQLAIHE